jgi:hypothetical protein
MLKRIELEQAIKIAKAEDEEAHYVFGRFGSHDHAITYYCTIYVELLVFAHILSSHTAISWFTIKH